MEIKIGKNLWIKTSQSHFFEDFPWDAYILKGNQKRIWLQADGITEGEALVKLLRKWEFEK